MDHKNKLFLAPLKLPTIKNLTIANEPEKNHRLNKTDYRLYPCKSIKFDAHFSSQSSAGYQFCIPCKYFP